MNIPTLKGENLKMMCIDLPLTVFGAAWHLKESLTYNQKSRSHKVLIEISVNN